VRPRPLFAERFGVEAAAAEEDASVYDDEKHYNVALDGSPYVEQAVTASTSTFTKVNAEPGDADRGAWERVLNAKLDTRTTARHDRDRP
jgi:hypothetical protein